MISLYSAEVRTLYPLDSIRRLRRSLSNEVTYTQRQASTPITSTSASIARRGALHRTRLSQSPYGQWLYMEATIHQVCLIFLSLDGAHLRSEVLHHDVLYTTKIKPLGVQPGLALNKVRAPQEALPSRPEVYSN